MSNPKARQAPGPAPQWIAEAPLKKVRGETTPVRRPFELPPDVQATVRRNFTGTVNQRERTVEMLTQAAEAYNRHRFEEALRLAKTVSERVPSVAEVRELAGLSAYRAERWAMARAHLNAHFELTNDPTHLPAAMDCARALGRHRAVGELFDQLMAASPTAEVAAEAKIVRAADLGDQGKLIEAIDLLEKAGGNRALRNPADRHLRLWYALGDLYDRAGESSRAREQFSMVFVVDPDAYDVRERLEEFGPARPKRNRPKRTTPTSTKRRDD
jgi:tetratricopeptide (TPR) repeat protein